VNNSKTNTKQKGAPETTGKTARKVAPESEIPAKTSVVVTAAPAKKFGSTPKKASKSTTPAKAVQVKSAPVVKPEETADAAPAKTAAADLSDMKKILGFEDLDEGGARPTYDDDFSDSFMTSDPIRDYLRQIGQIALLTHEQEKDIAKRIEVGLYAEHKLKAARDEYDSVDIRNLRRLVEEGNRAKEHLVEANLRLVVSLAKRFSGRGMRFQDLIQEGNIGLTRAVEKYDYSKSFRFSTYATWWIRQSITRAIADQGRTIRIPVHMIEIINRLAKVQKRLTVELGRSPSNAELAEQLDVSEQRISEIQKYSREPASIYATIGEDGDTEYGDLIEDTNVPDQIDVVSERFMREQLHKIIDTLSEKERAVITMRYGLEDQIVHTLDEIGRKLDVTRERIRQIEAKTMSKLQHPARSQLLKDYYER
jgi:RNA polymerase primary sigma factor